MNNRVPYPKYNNGNRFIRILFITLVLSIIILILIAFLETVIGRPGYRDRSCHVRRWGCCPDNLTTRLDPYGTNCIPRPEYRRDKRLCSRSYYGCCKHPSWRFRENISGTNCIARDGDFL